MQFNNYNRVVNMLLLNDINVFCTVVRLNSFSLTAERFKITTAAISKKISNLETKLGVKLLNRTTRKIYPTEIGILLYNRSESILSALEDVETEITKTQLEPKGKITILSPTNFANLKLAPIIAEFLIKYKKIQIEVALNDSRIMPMDTNHDLIIRAGTIPDKNVIARKLITCDWVLCANEKYLKKHGTPMIPSELKMHNCLDYDYRQISNVWGFYKDDQEYIIDIKGSVISNNALYIKQMAIHGTGIAFLPDFMVEEDIRNNKLTPLLKEYAAIEIPIYIMFPHGKMLPNKIRLFIDFIVNSFQK